MTSESGVSRPGAVFLDRDGVINDPAWDEADGKFEAPLRPEDVALADGAVEGLRELKEAGFLLLVVSNQPSAAKGKTTFEQLGAVHDRVEQLLTVAGVSIDAWRYCYHHPNGVRDEWTGDCECRKPKPGMLLDAAAEFGVDLAKSWMVGDSDADIAAGAAAGCSTVLVEHPRSAHRRSPGQRPDARALNLAAAVKEIRDV